MAKSENSLKRFFHLSFIEKPYCRTVFKANMTYVSYVIFGISEPFCHILLQITSFYEYKNLHFWTC